MTLGTFAFAQKEYVHVKAEVEAFTDPYTKKEYDRVHLSGAIPSTMKIEYGYGDKTMVVDVINMLAKEGFVVEQMQMSANSSPECFLLSRNSSNTPSAIQRVQTSPDEEVTEVARYNLQGIPVSKSEKGVQIVVYSNYTTKTIIVE
jgi:K+ transporter